jgi:hypothetical protein
MNYDQARQREGTKKWDYTRRNDDHIYPLGYCGRYSWAEPYDPTKHYWIDKDHYERLKAEGDLFKDKYHTTGHDTPEEACECYKEYLLDSSLDLNRETADTQHKCEKCGAWTTKMAMVDRWSLYHLCDEHRNRETVAELFSVGTSCHS